MSAKERISLGFDDLSLAEEPHSGDGHGSAPDEDALAPLDTSGFAPVRRSVDAPALDDARRVAEKVGFRSREPKPQGGRASRKGKGPTRKGAADDASACAAKDKPDGAPREAPSPTASAVEPHRPPVRRRRTGRNVQFNIKARAETIAAFTAIADAQDWGFGETLEHAVELLEKAYGSR